MKARCRAGRWWWGVPVVALLAAGTSWFSVPRIEADLARRLAATGAGRVVVVEGRDVVAAESDGSLANLDLRRVPGVRRLAPREGDTPLVGPVLTLRRDGQRIMIGGVIAPALRKAMESELRAGGFGGEIADETSRSDAEATSAAQSAVLLAARHLVRLEASEASLAGASLTLSGTAPDFATYNAIRDEWRSPPAGITAATVGLIPPAAVPFSWAAERREDAVALTGFVPSEGERDAVLARVRASLAGVPLSDRMQTARGAPASISFADASQFALDQLARLDRGRVEMAGAVLSIEGGGQDREALAGIGQAMRAALPAGLSLGSVALTPLAVSPYSFAARRGQGLLTLTGYVPDEAARSRLLEIGRKAFLTEQIVDRLRVGDGAPATFLAGAAFALEQLGQIANGEARIQDKALRVDGEALYRQSGERVRARILSEAPAGWKSSADIAITTRERVLEPDLCQDLLAEAAGRDPVTFEPKAVALAPDGQQRVGAVAAILRRCGNAPVAVGIDGSEETEASLASGRIDVVIAALKQAGIESGRLRAAEPKAATQKAGADKQATRPAISFSVMP